jgi:anti-sigma factor RsiW
MTEGTDARMQHPDELLAGYVDGSASPEEGRAVEAHLAECQQCRNEIALAESARAALLSLPEMEAPGLTVPSAAAGGDEVAGRREARRGGERQLRRWRVSWAALAGTAAVLALLAVIPLVLTRGGGGRLAVTGPGAKSGSRAPQAAFAYPPVLDLSSNYDPESVQALADRLGDRAKLAIGEASGPLASATSPKASRPAPSPIATGPIADLPSADVVQCVVQATGLPSDTVPVYLEIATFRGTPAYLAGVKAQGTNRSHLRLYVVSRQGCTFLFEADQPL